MPEFSGKFHPLVLLQVMLSYVTETVRDLKTSYMVAVNRN